MAQAPTSTLLDEWLNHLTEHPRHMLFGMVVIVSSTFSLIGLLIGFIVFAVMRLFNCSVLVIGGVALLGLICIALAWGVDGVTLIVVKELNRVLWRAMFSGDWRLALSLFSWLAAAPYGIVIGCLLNSISLMRSRVTRDVKRVARGILATGKKQLSEKQLQKALANCAGQQCLDGTTLGVDKHTGQPAILFDADANLHTLVIGTTGSGKTVTLMNIIASAIERRWPLLFVDGKGDVTLMKRIEAIAKARGIPFYGFSMIGESLKYNPIASGGYTSKKDRLIELREWSEDHYRKLAEGYLQTVFKILEQLNVDVDLWQLAKYLEPEKLYLLARQQQNADVLEMIGTLEEKRKDISGVIAEIQNITQSEIGHLFDCSQGEVLNIEKAIDERGIVYCCLQPLAFPAYAATLGKLIVNDIKAVVSKQLLKESKTKLFTIFDEFSIFAGEQIINLINQGRSAGVHAVLATQSLSDITSKGDEALLGQVLNNCNNYIIQRQNNPDDAETLASVIGTKDAYQVTSQVTTQMQSAQAGTVRIAKEFIVHPDEIKRLGVGEAVILSKREFSLKLVKINQQLIP